jgi:hypothetical protein
MTNTIMHPFFREVKQTILNFPEPAEVEEIPVL